jgi:hypothetical protein
MVISVCCQVSLLLGTIIRKIPLPSSSNLDTLVSGVAFSDAADSSVMAISDAMLDVKQLETIGSHFLEVLLKMKHNGAIDKTRAGFTALCNRLLCSNDPRYVSIWSFYSSCIMIFYFISCLRLSLKRSHDIYYTSCMSLAAPTSLFLFKTTEAAMQVSIEKKYYIANQLLCSC